MGNTTQTTFGVPPVTITAHAKPFVKWAGGKRQLIPVLEEHLPKHFNSYLEPFLGGGAFLFYIMTNHTKRQCIVSDLNSDLITTYTIVRDNIDDLLCLLRDHDKEYRTDPKMYYYMIRDGIDPSDINETERAARLLFLNRTCFNGMYRVNHSGKFNVPLGKYSNPNIVNEEILRSASTMLKTHKVTIKCRDFTSVLFDAKENDLVYLDPPYHPVSQDAFFTSYTKHDFGKEDLQRLAKLCNELDSKGCKVLLSNSTSPVVTALFSDRPWKITRTMCKRLINTDSSKRSGHFELLIKNY